MTGKAKFRLGTRGSPLALTQAREVRHRLGAAHGDLAEEGAVEIVVIKTTGDKVQDRALAEIGGKGLFTKEIEDALLAGEIDAAVHSMKDVPTWLPEGLVVDHVLPREDPRDAFFSSHGNSLAALPADAVVGTSSLRRQAQVLIARPDLRVEPIRGNVDTRLRKLEEGRFHATLLAVAGLKRLGLADKITAALSTEEMLPAVAQGAIGLEMRADDDATRGLLDAISCVDSGRRVSAERAFLTIMEGSCRTPIAGLAELGDDDALRLRGLVALPDGSAVYKADILGSAKDAAGLGAALGQELRAAAGPDFHDAVTGR